MRHPASDTFVTALSRRDDGTLSLRVALPGGRLSGGVAALRLATLLSACGAREGDEVEVTVRVVEPEADRGGAGPREAQQ